MQALIAEIDEKINSVFEINENGTENASPPATFKTPGKVNPKKTRSKNSRKSPDSQNSAKKKAIASRPIGTRSARKRNVRKNVSSSEESDSD